MGIAWVLGTVLGTVALGALGTCSPSRRPELPTRLSRRLQLRCGDLGRARTLGVGFAWLVIGVATAGALLGVLGGLAD